jgi:hypothetical protein
MELLGDGQGAAAILLAPEHERRHVDVREKVPRVDLGRGQRHQAKPDRVEIGDDGGELVTQVDASKNLAKSSRG